MEIEHLLFCAMDGFYTALKNNIFWLQKYSFVNISIQK